MVNAGLTAATGVTKSSTERSTVVDYRHFSGETETDNLRLPVERPAPHFIHKRLIVRTCITQVIAGVSACVVDALLGAVYEFAW